MKSPRIISIVVNLLATLVLTAGLGAAVLIYQNAEERETRILTYEGQEGSSYPIPPGDSKKYLRELELYGGKANVLATELRGWFAGLWQGKSLAFIVAAISVGLSVAGFYGGSRIPGSSCRSGDRDQGNSG